MSEEIRSNQPDKVTLCLPAKHIYLSMIGVSIENLIKRLGGSERAIYDIQIAIQEICANVVDHAYRELPLGTLTVEIILDGSELYIFVVDEGHEFNPERSREPILGQLQERGYGLFFARKLMDEVRYDRVDQQNRWTLRKSLVLETEVEIY